MAVTPDQLDMLARLAEAQHTSSIVTTAIGAFVAVLLALVAWFSRDRLTAIDKSITSVKTEVGTVSGELRHIATTINGHTTQLALHEQSIRALEREREIRQLRRERDDLEYSRSRGIAEAKAAAE